MYGVRKHDMVIDMENWNAKKGGKTECKNGIVYLKEREITEKDL